MSHIVSFLHTKVRPEIGGATWFMDLVNGWKWYKLNYPEKAALLSESQIKMITDFVPDINLMKFKGTLNIPNTIHPTVSVNPYNNEETLFLCSGCDEVATLINYKGNEKVTNVIEEIIENFGIYKHYWEEGDMLIWDNIQSLHRSAGDF